MIKCTGEKTIKCVAYYSRTHREIAEIVDSKYWRIFRKVRKEWNNLTKLSCETKLSVADIIADKYNTCYAVGADIANSIALSTAIG